MYTYIHNMHDDDVYTEITYMNIISMCDSIYVYLNVYVCITRSMSSNRKRTALGSCIWIYIHICIWMRWCEYVYICTVHVYPLDSCNQLFHSSSNTCNQLFTFLIFKMLYIAKFLFFTSIFQLRNHVTIFFNDILSLSSSTTVFYNVKYLTLFWL